MATVIPFEERAVAHLRERLGAAEEANQDLIAFARGHSGATAPRLDAVLGAYGSDGGGVQEVDPAILRRAIGQVDGVDMRTVERGHPLFGPACELIRAEALIRIECEPPLPSGLLALGQRAELSIDGRHGCELLMFLGRSLAAIIRKWLTHP
jgi:hypothetical protein